MSRAAGHTPPLGLDGLTPLYDRAIALFTRERRWRGALVELIGPRPGETILDVGSGTGSLALALAGREPRSVYRGIDPDPKAVALARAKVPDAGFEVALLPDRPPSPAARVDTIVASLVLHQVPMAEKVRLLAAMRRWLKPGGRLLVADYGRQRGLQRLAFQLTVQLLDGTADSAANAAGRIPQLIAEAGFAAIRSAARFATPSGTIELWQARPGEAR